MKVLIIAPHPDDEVLGVGGTIARLVSEGNGITVAIVTRGWEPLFPNTQVEHVREEAHRANELLGVKTLRFMDLPVTKLNAIPKHELNKKFEQLLDEEKPQLVFLPFRGDLQEDHRQVFDASMVALRPLANRRQIKKVLCYETVSETHCTTGRAGCFEPQLWVDISNHLSAKIEAMRIYLSQLQPEPGTRSLEAISSLARWRGSTAGMFAAECFMVVREYV